MTTAEFGIDSWDENPFDEEGRVAKLTTALVKKRYSGAIDGTSVTEWVMAYNGETADFVGIERIRGTVDGRSGTLVLRHVGRFGDGVAKADLLVVSGTDQLDGVTGTGSMVADPAGKVELTLTTP